MDTKKKILLGGVFFLLVVMTAYDWQLISSGGMSLLQIPFFITAVVMILWRKELRKKK